MRTSSPASPSLAVRPYAPARRRGVWLRKAARYVIAYALIVPGALIFLFPLLWMVSTALKEPNQIFVSPPQWIPPPPGLAKFIEA